MSTKIDTAVLEITTDMGSYNSGVDAASKRAVGLGDVFKQIAGIFDTTSKSVENTGQYMKAVAQQAASFAPLQAAIKGFSDEMKNASAETGGWIPILKEMGDSWVARIAEGILLRDAIHDVIDGIKEAALALPEIALKGASVGDVEENFKRLTSQAGMLGDVLLGTLKTGTHNTITDFELMKTVNSDLAAGMNLTDKQFGTLAKGAFSLAQATGTDVKTALDTMNDAMLTGRTRALALLTGKIDLTKAEEDYARSLGSDVEHLSEAGKLEAARLGILKSVGDATERLGEQTDGLDERVAQVETTWANFKEDLGKTIATSSVLEAGMNGLASAIKDAMGDSQQQAVKAVSKAVDELLIHVMDFVSGGIQAAGFLVKEWYAVYKILGDTRQIIDGNRFAIQDLSIVVNKAAAATSFGNYSKGFSDEANRIELAQAALAKAMIERGASLKQADKDQADVDAITAGYVKTIEDLKAKMQAAQTGTTAFVGPVEDLASATDRAALAAQQHAAMLTRSKEEISKAKAAAEEFKKAMAEVASVGDDWQNTLDGIDGAVVEGAKYYIQAGLSLGALKTMYGLTETQVKALQAAVKADAETQKDTAVSIGQTEALWAEYFKNVAAGSQQSLKAKLADVDKWEADQLTALNKTAKYNENYENQLQAIYNTADSKRAAAEQEAFDKSVKLENDHLHIGLDNMTKWLQAEGAYVNAYAADQKALSDAFISNQGIIKAAEADTALVIQKQTLSTVDYQIAQVKHWQDLQEGLIEYGASNWVKAYQSIGAEAKAKIDEIIQAQISWKQSLSEIATAFETIGSEAGGTFGEIAKDVGAAVKAGQDLTKAFKVIATAGTSAAEGGWNPQNLAALAAGWLGVAVAVYSFVDSLIKAKEAQDKLNAAIAFAGGVQRDFEANQPFTQSLTDSIQTTEGDLDALAKALFAFQQANHDLQFFTVPDNAADFGRQLAEALHLTDIIKELGGVSHLTADQTKLVWQEVGDLFGLIENGGADAVAATQSLNDTLVAFGDAAEKSGGLVSQAYIDAVKQAKAAGIELDGVNDQIQAQLKESATGLDRLINGLQAGARANATAYAKSQGMSDDDAKKAGDKANFGFSDKEAAGLGAALSASFSEAIDRGMSFKDALAQIQAPLDGLISSLQESGKSGGAAFDTLVAESQIANDAIMGPFADAIQGADQALKGLHNSGILTQDMFTGIADSAVDAYNNIIDEGGNAQGAMAIMQPTLQTIWEEQKNFGYAVDDATQSLLDQAEASGTVGEQFESAQDKMNDGIQRIADATEGLAKVFGVVLPDAANKGADGINTALGKVTPPDLSQTKKTLDTDVPAAAAKGSSDAQTQLDNIQVPQQLIDQLSKAFKDGLPADAGAGMDDIQAKIDALHLPDDAKKAFETWLNEELPNNADASAKTMQGSIDGLHAPEDLKNALAKLFGTDLPADAGQAAKGVQTALDGIKAPTLNLKINMPPLPPGDWNDGWGDGGTGIKKMAAGGDFHVTRPTLFLAGESGPEDASFSGANKSFQDGQPSPSPIQVHLTVAPVVNSVIPMSKTEMKRFNEEVLVPAWIDAVNRDVAGLQGVVSKASSRGR